MGSTSLPEVMHALVIDVNAHVGDWAFRKLPCSDAANLGQLLGAQGIDAAVVGPVEGVLYRDPSEANELLFERLQGAPTAPRLLAAAVVNPAFPGWERHLEQAIDAGARAVKLYPNYHDYSPAGPQAQKLAQAAAEAGLPIICCVRVEDERQHHWHLLMPPAAVGDVVSLARAVPEAQVVLAVAKQGEMEAFLKAAPPDRTWAEVSYLKSPTESVRHMVSRYGADRLLFGTHAPFLNPGVAKLKVERADIGEQAKAAILGENALRLWPELVEAAGT